MEYIKVLYTCNECRVVDRAVQVPARGSEDVKTWMDATMVLVVRDHRYESPECQPEKFTEVKIPMTDTDRVGGPQIN